MSVENDAPVFGDNSYINKYHKRLIKSESIIDLDSLFYSRDRQNIQVKSTGCGIIKSCVINAM